MRVVLDLSLMYRVTRDGGDDGGFLRGDIAKQVETVNAKVDEGATASVRLRQHPRAPEVQVSLHTGLVESKQHVRDRAELAPLPHLDRRLGEQAVAERHR